MLLALDVGNTNMVLGLYRLNSGEGGAAEMVANWRVTTPLSQTADEFGLLLKSLFGLRGLELGVVDGIAIASVVPPLDSAAAADVRVYFKIKPLFIEPGVKTGMPVLTDNPAEVGADRIVNCVAATIRFGGPVIIVDMGTATKFDVVSKKGEFLGGAIAPGLGISADALFNRAARLPRIEIKKPAEGDRDGYGGQHPDRVVLRVHRAGGRDPGADDGGDGAGDEDDCHGRPGEADRGRVEVHRIGGRDADADGAAAYL